MRSVIAGLLSMIGVLVGCSDGSPAPALQGTEVIDEEVESLLLATADRQLERLVSLGPVGRFEVLVAEVEGGGRCLVLRGDEREGLVGSCGSEPVAGFGTVLTVDEPDGSTLVVLDPIDLDDVTIDEMTATEVGSGVVYGVARSERFTISGVPADGNPMTYCPQGCAPDG